MIGTSASEYVFIRTCILLLQCLPLLSIIYYFVVFPFAPDWIRLHTLIEYWFALEACFFLFFFLPYKWYLQSPAAHPPLPSRADRRKSFDLVLANISDAEKYVCGWFKGAPLCDIGRDDVILFLAWAFLNKEDVDEQDQEELEEYLQKVEKLLGQSFRPGTGRARPLRLTLSPVHMLHRSLIWYLVSSHHRQSRHTSKKSLIVRWCRRYYHPCPDATHVVPLPSLIHHTILYGLPNSATYPAHQIPLTCQALIILAPSAYFKDTSTNSVHTWHWYWPLPSNFRLP